jgi:hypothetical protein
MTALMGDKFKPVVWWRDYLPNYIWLCWHTSSGEYLDVFAASKYLDEIDTALGDGREAFPPDWHLNGRLSDFEEIPIEARARMLDQLQMVGAYEHIVPKDFAIALGMYADAPGRWIIEPWLEGGLTIDPETAQRELGRVVAESIDGRGDAASRAKALFFRQKLKSGNLFFSREGLGKETEEAIQGYPKMNTEEQNARAESHFRAMFLAIEGDAHEWSKTFWRTNWALFPCRAAAAEIVPDALPTTSHEARTEIAALRSRAEEIWESFVRVSRTTDPDLYAPDRFEVLTGIVGRALRLVRLIAGYPPMWTMEHGAPVLRALVESRILGRFLNRKEDPALYSKYKSYGVGHLKLYKLHLEEFIGAAAEAGEGMREYLDLVTAYVNRDTFEEFIDIDLGGSFAGSDMRKMSDEVGLADDYRLLFAPASSNVHGEWGALDMNVFETCRNPLHGGHRILLDEQRSVIGPHFIEDVLDYARELADEYQEFVSPDPVDSREADK